jgi:hypothetical protein
MTIELDEITTDNEGAMLCSGYIQIASFKNWKEFKESNFCPSLPPPYRASTSGASVIIWADDPQFRDCLRGTCDCGRNSSIIYTEFVPATEDTPLNVTA